MYLMQPGTVVNNRKLGSLRGAPMTPAGNLFVASPVNNAFITTPRGGQVPIVASTQALPDGTTAIVRRVNPIVPIVAGVFSATGGGQIAPATGAEFNPGYVNAQGQAWKYNGRNWLPTPPATSAVPGSPVPSNYPTTQVYVDAGGNQWQFNPRSGQWQQISSITQLQTSSQYYPGTPVPANYPTNQLFVDGAGNTWGYVNGAWVNEGVQLSTSTSALGPDGSPAVAAAAPSSDYQSILDWFSESTLISSIPNWVIAAGVGFLAIKMSKGK